MTGRYRQIKRDLKDFLQIVAPRYPLLIKCLFDAFPVKGHDINDIGKVSCQPNQLENVSDFRCLQPINVIEYHHNRFVESGKSFFKFGSLLKNSFLLRWSELAQSFRYNTTPLNPWTNNRQPPHAGEYLAIILKMFAYFSEGTIMNLQLGGEFNKKRLDKLRRTTEHPRIKVEYGDFGFLKLIPGKVDKRRFSRTPRTKDADYNSLRGIKGEYMLSEILSDRNSTDNIIFGIFYRVVTNDHHVSPMQIGTLWNESVFTFSRSL